MTKKYLAYNSTIELIFKIIYTKMGKNKFKIVLFAILSIFITTSFAQQIDPDILAKAKMMGFSEDQIKSEMSKYKSESITEVSSEKISDNQYSLRDKPNQAEYDSTIVEDLKSIYRLPIIKETPLSIYGQNMFKNSEVSYEPNLNIPTPIDYILSIGDEIIINVWGDSESTVKETISPEGLIYISNLGPVYINGMTVSQAKEYIEKQLSKIDESIGSTSQITLSVGQIRSIKVNITGEVSYPGVYTVPSLASLFHILHISGGTTDIGDLRHIEVFRNSKKVADMDIYDFILNGNISNNIILKDGDVVVVPTYKIKAKIAGAIKRSMFYLMKDSETVSTLIQYAGGFSDLAYQSRVKIFRKGGEYNEVILVEQADFNKMVLRNGDSVLIENAKDEFENLIQIEGAIWYPGDFQLNDNLNTLSKLIEYAGGLKGSAFSQSAIIERRNSDYSESIINFNPTDIVSGKSDIELRNYDKVIIPEVGALQEPFTINVLGEVNSPNVIKFRNGMRIEDAIILSGGLKESASLSIIDVSRRINDNKLTEYTDQKSELFSFNINEDLSLTPETKDFILKPYDMVVIRRSPGYKVQSTIVIQGEVVVPGSYTIERENTYLSDVIKMAKGTTPLSHTKGASLMRMFNDKNMTLGVDKLQRTVSTSEDSLKISANGFKLLPVAINLDAALKDPHGKSDILLKQGDVITIPKFENIVRTIGAVYSENSITYQGGKLKKYIESSGGYIKQARKRPFVLYQNGTIKATKRIFFIKKYPKIEPGCVVIVPQKPARAKMSLFETLGVASSVTSLASSLATLGLNIAVAR